MNLLVLDIREEAEAAGAAIPGALHIPKSQVEARVAEIPSGKNIIVVCRIGVHSLDVLRFLADHGDTRLFNLEGGYLAWVYRIGRGAGA